jgi:restriction endonuclease S subunit
MSRVDQVGNHIDSISVTHKFDSEELIFLNTSDVLEGEILSQKLFRIEDLKGQAKKTIKNEDILFSEIRPKNKRYAFVEVSNPDDYVVSTKLMVLRNKSSELLTKYIYYFLTYEGTLNYLQMRAENRIGSFPQITFDHVKVLEIPLQDRSTQEEIVRLTSIIDKKISLNNALVSNITQQGQYLYTYWFKNFEFLDDFGKKYKSNGGQFEWSNKLGREIPKGWKVVPLSELIKESKGGDWGEDKSVGNYDLEVSCVRGTDIEGLNGLGECSPPVRFINKKNSFKVLDLNNLIIEISGGSPTQSTGRLGYITEGLLKRFSKKIICSNFCRALELQNPKMVYNFALEWDELYRRNIFFNFEGKTSGIKNLLFDSFVSSYFIELPDEKVVDRFYEILQQLDEKKQIALRENEYLKNLRNWLLPKLMTGAIKIQ